MTLKPSECMFSIGTDLYLGVLEGQICVFPKDRQHPLYESLTEIDLAQLPKFLASRTMDAENTWCFESITESVLKSVKQDMISLGYTWKEGYTGLYGDSSIF